MPTKSRTFCTCLGFCEILGPVDRQHEGQFLVGEQVVLADAVLILDQEELGRLGFFRQPAMFDGTSGSLAMTWRFRWPSTQSVSRIFCFSSAVTR